MHLLKFRSIALYGSSASEMRFHSRSRHGAVADPYSNFERAQSSNSYEQISRKLKSKRKRWNLARKIQLFCQVIFVVHLGVWKYYNIILDLKNLNMCRVRSRRQRASTREDLLLLFFGALLVDFCCCCFRATETIRSSSKDNATRRRRSSLGRVYIATQQHFIARAPWISIGMMKNGMGWVRETLIFAAGFWDGFRAGAAPAWPSSASSSFVFRLGLFLLYIYPRIEKERVPGAALTRAATYSCTANTTRSLEREALEDDPRRDETILLRGVLLGIYAGQIYSIKRPRIMYSFSCIRVESDRVAWRANAKLFIRIHTRARPHTTSFGAWDIVEVSDQSVAATTISRTRRTRSLESRVGPPPMSYRCLDIFRANYERIDRRTPGREAGRVACTIMCTRRGVGSGESEKRNGRALRRTKKHTRGQLVLALHMPHQKLAFVVNAVLDAAELAKEETHAELKAERRYRASHTKERKVSKAFSENCRLVQQQHHHHAQGGKSRKILLPTATTIIRHIIRFIKRDADTAAIESFMVKINSIASRAVTSINSRAAAANGSSSVEVKLHIASEQLDAESINEGQRGIEPAAAAAARVDRAEMKEFCSRVQLAIASWRACLARSAHAHCRLRRDAHAVTAASNIITLQARVRVQRHIKRIRSHRRKGWKVRLNIQKTRGSTRWLGELLLLLLQRTAPLYTNPLITATRQRRVAAAACVGRHRCRSSRAAQLLPLSSRARERHGAAAAAAAQRETTNIPEYRSSSRAHESLVYELSSNGLQCKYTHTYTHARRRMRGRRKL
ncbi:unnamed protein product [Trichogramma brassicae]|uniref:Uncharacterized protein n=1 Tax=Trichogramma brassicae TaxID=86971 RepID=A0A6H5IHX3_9HYME|nr:unnamed protein product [Trichogramma brassicae]